MFVEMFVICVSVLEGSHKYLPNLISVLVIQDASGFKEWNKR
jgi:hypothetical protein